MTSPAIRSRIFIAPIFSSGKRAAMPRSIASNQASIMSVAPPGKASRARGAGTPSSAAAMASASSLQPSNTALAGTIGASAIRSSSRFISFGAISGMGIQ